MGLFVVFEGVDHSGKSTLLRKVNKILEKKFMKILTTFEPGDAFSGKIMRHILLHDKKFALTPKSELLLFLADRHHHLEKILLPNLTKYDVILCDRYFYSTFVYQGLINKVDTQLIFDFHEKLGLFKLLPDLVFYLKADWKVWKERHSCLNKKITNTKITVALSKGLEHFQKVQNYYEVFFTKTMPTLFSSQQNYSTKFITTNVGEKSLEVLAKEIAWTIYEKWEKKQKP